MKIADEVMDGGGIAMLEITDVTGQRRTEVTDVPGDETVGRLIDELLSELELGTTDVEGRPLTYQARLEREGRHLHASETVGEALRAGDRLTLQPSIDAGGTAS